MHFNQTQEKLSDKTPTLNSKIYVTKNDNERKKWGTTRICTTAYCYSFIYVSNTKTLIDEPNR